MVDRTNLLRAITQSGEAIPERDQQEDDYPIVLFGELYLLLLLHYKRFTLYVLLRPEIRFSHWIILYSECITKFPNQLLFLRYSQWGYQ